MGLAASASVGLAALSLRHVVTLPGRAIPYPGMQALSAVWTPPPDDDEADWLVSAGVDPPPSSAQPAELRIWLEQRYPVLALGLTERDVLQARRVLSLGGGPPRSLYVEPGVGLVMRVPRD